LSNKIKRAGRHIAYVIFSNIIFGLIYYFVFSWLVGHSLLYAYLGCLVLIVFGLALDKVAVKSLTSKSTVMELKKLPKKNREKNYRLLQLIIDSFVSFKTILFVFYIFILIASQIISIDPTLLGENITDFIIANSYGIVLLMAVDRIIGQFSQDRKDMKKNSEILRESLDKDEN